MAFLVFLFFIKQIANTKPTIINTAYAAKKIYTQGASIPILKCRMIKKVKGSRLTPIGANLNKKCTKIGILDRK